MSLRLNRSDGRTREDDRPALRIFTIPRGPRFRLPSAAVAWKIARASRCPLSKITFCALRARGERVPSLKQLDRSNRSSRLTAFRNCISRIGASGDQCAANVIDRAAFGEASQPICIPDICANRFLRKSCAAGVDAHNVNAHARPIVRRLAAWSRLSGLTCLRERIGRAQRAECAFWLELLPVSIERSADSRAGSPAVLFARARIFIFKIRSRHPASRVCRTQ